MKSHAANVQKSARLKRLLGELSSGSLKTTGELQKKTGSMAIHSDVHELRCNGIQIGKAVYLGVQNGNKVYGYQLELR